MLCFKVDSACFVLKIFQLGFAQYTLFSVIIHYSGAFIEVISLFEENIDTVLSFFISLSQLVWLGLFLFQRKLGWLKNSVSFWGNFCYFCIYTQCMHAYWYQRGSTLKSYVLILIAFKLFVVLIWIYGVYIYIHDACLHIFFLHACSLKSTWFHTQQYMLCRCQWNLLIRKLAHSSLHLPSPNAYLNSRMN